MNLEILINGNISTALKIYNYENSNCITSSNL